MHSRRDSATHSPQVGAWIDARREQMGITQTALADLAGVSWRSAWNAINGKSAIDKSRRADWERALGWTPGSLTAAYDHGTEPALIASDHNTTQAGPSIREILADLPPDRRGVLEEQLARLVELGMPPEDRAQVAADWVQVDRLMQSRLEAFTRELLQGAAEMRRQQIETYERARAKHPRSAG